LKYDVGGNMKTIKWESPYRGIKTKKHPTRKHGVKADVYYAVRFQHNGKRRESGLGWATEGWTLDKAITKLGELKKIAKKGDGVQTFRERQTALELAKQEQESKEREIAEKKRKRSLSIHDFFHKFYFLQIQREKKPKTYQREESLFRLWIDKNVGSQNFWETTKADIESIFYDMVDSGRSVRSAEYALTTLKQIWRDAREAEYAPEMPKISKSTNKKISQNNNSRIRFLSGSEVDMLLEEIKKVSPALYEKTLISLHCGLRASEIFNLTWSQVDLDHGIFNIINSKGADRSVNMTKDVLKMMKKKKQGQLNELVFPGRQGKASKQISQKFRKIANKLFNQNVTDRRERVTFHTCRHTCASWMVKQGVSLYLVQKVMGHSTIQVTERYAHLAPDQLQLAANAIDRAVENSGKIILYHSK
jgi:integrase